MSERNRRGGGGEEEDSISDEIYFSLFVFVDFFFRILFLRKATLVDLFLKNKNERLSRVSYETIFRDARFFLIKNPKKERRRTHVWISISFQR